MGLHTLHLYMCICLCIAQQLQQQRTLRDQLSNTLNEILRRDESTASAREKADALTRAIEQSDSNAVVIGINNTLQEVLSNQHSKFQEEQRKANAAGEYAITFVLSYVFGLLLCYVTTTLFTFLV